MANRAFLFSRSKAEFDGSSDFGSEILCGASDMIPLFWYSLLDASCIRRLKLEEGEEEFLGGVTHFVTETKAGLARSRARAEALAYLIGGRADEWHQFFVQFIEAEASTFLHFWVYELWMLHDLGEFDEQVHGCLSAFDAPQYETVGWLNKRRVMTKPWKTLLGQAQISPANITGTLEAYKCCGYGWLRQVPWEPGTPSEEE